MRIRDYTISELFDYMPGNHGLTEELIYNQTPGQESDCLPVFSGSEDNEQPIGFIARGAQNKAGKPISSFDGPCLILSKDGSAGLLTYRPKGSPFTINHHACVLVPREDAPTPVDPLWFAQQYQRRLFQVVTSKNDNRVFTTDWFDRLPFPLPDIDVQRRQRQKKEGLTRCRRAISDARQRVARLLAHEVRTRSRGNEPERRVVPDLFCVHSGTSRLTAEFIYKNAPKSAADSVEVLSGATLEENRMGCVSGASLQAAGLAQKILPKQGEYILLTRKGYYAGTIDHVSGRRFIANDDAYLLEPAPDGGNGAALNLRWFVQQHRALFRRVTTSREDNGTFNKQWLARMTVAVPRREVQDAVADRVEALCDVAVRLRSMEEMLSALIAQPLSCANRRA